MRKVDGGATKSNNETPVVIYCSFSPLLPLSTGTNRNGSLEYVHVQHWGSTMVVGAEFESGRVHAFLPWHTAHNAPTVLYGGIQKRRLAKQNNALYLGLQVDQSNTWLTRPIHVHDWFRSLGPIHPDDCCCLVYSSAAPDARLAIASASVCLVT